MIHPGGFSMTQTQQQSLQAQQQQLQQLMKQAMPGLEQAGGSPTSAGTPSVNGTPGAPELTGDSLWDSLYNTTIRTLSLEGLELLAKSFDNLDPNHQLYAGIAKRQRKLMEYQSEFRRNLEVFCQRANLNPKMWPSCIRHVKPTTREDSADLLTWPSGASKQDSLSTPGPVGTAVGVTNSTPSEHAQPSSPSATPVPHQQQSTEEDETTQTSSSDEPRMEQAAVETATTTTVAEEKAVLWSPKQQEEQKAVGEEVDEKTEKEGVVEGGNSLATAIASASIADDPEDDSKGSQGGDDDDGDDKTKTGGIW